MIKYIMRKFIYNEIDHDMQDALIKLLKPYWSLHALCCQHSTINMISPWIPLWILCIAGGKNLVVPDATAIAVITFLLIHFTISLVFAKVFEEAYSGFAILLLERSYFLLCTKKGKAISRKDLKTIKKVNPKLFEYISTQKCSGLCYAICFETLKALKKGKIEFSASKWLQCDKTDDNEGKYFTAHVLYVNNGWAFDTFSARQYKIDDLHEIYEAKIYKSFDYEAIQGKTYEEFREDEAPEFEKWCAENDCTVEFRED